MSFFVWVEVVCRGCAKTAAGRYTTSTIPRRDILKEAQQEGWIREGDEMYCGNSCLQQVKEEINED